MTSETRHLIRKQILEISACSLPVAQWWDQQSGALVQDFISPCLQTCFDRIDGTGEHIIIDRLEIDLGAITEHNYKQVVPERLNAALNKALSGLRPKHAPLQERTGSGGERARPHKSPGDNTGQEASILDPHLDKNRPAWEPEPPRRLSAEEASLEAFIFYLSHGVLPWWFDRPTDKGPPWDATWLEDLNPPQLRRILDTLKLPTAAQRLIYRFDDEPIGRVVTVSLELSAREPAALWKELARQLAETDSPLRRQLRMYFWREWINAGLAGARKEQCVHMIGELILHHAPLGAAAVRLMEADLQTPNEATAESLLQQVLDVVRRNVSRQGTEPGARNRRPDFRVINDLSEAVERSTERETEHVVDEADKTPSLPEATLQQGVFTQGAGIILLHPFLAELFDECGLWRKGGWCGQTSAQLAVHLLSWLVNGDTPQPEYHLPLQKRLCGMAINEPLMEGVVIDPRQQESCLTLLKAVVQHWGALGNTSPDGLREGFLRREGLLQTRDQGWRLSIEKKAQDVLLSKLPWGISLIRLPWMERQRIFVDWI